MSTSTPRTRRARTRSRAPWFYAAVVAVGLSLSPLLGLAVVADPSRPGLVDGTDVMRSDREFLVREGVLSDDERVELFYPTGTTCVDGGNVLTDRRVIGYGRLGGRLVTFAASHRDIASIEITRPGAADRDSVAEIRTTDGAAFELSLPTRDGGDDRFVAEVRRWTRAHAAARS